jgi:hypothetical protein
MTPDEALRVLDLPPTTSWADIKGAYRTRIRAAHPDVTGGSAAAAAHLNEAFALLERIYRRGLDPGPASAAPRTPPVAVPDDLAALDDDSLALEAPHEEVFLRLHAAIDELGTVTYADPEAGYLEGLLEGPLGPSQLVVSLQGRAQATEAFFTLEPLGAHPAPPIERVVRAIAALVRRGVPPTRR